MNNPKTRILKQRIGQLVIFCGPLTTFLVNPWSNYDPIGLIKLVSISSFGFGILFLLVFKSQQVINEIPKILMSASLAFVLCMVSTILFSGAPINQQIWGSFGRNTGFVTYISLISILVGAVVAASKEFYARLLNVFVYSSLLMTAYCTIQFLKLDPIKWSEQGVFGTLGNINFLSAYFGMTSLSILALILGKGLTRKMSLFLGLKVLWDLFLVASTKSIQGLVLFAAGLVFLGFLLVRRLGKYWILGYSLLSFVALYFTILGLLNKGPLARFLFQTSVVFRGDYMHAGFVMTLKKPLFGVGMDSYGDWYREVRGQISTLRTGPDRISNTAHNIFLDISSNGGIPLFLCYLALNLFVLFSIIQMLKRYKKIDTVFMALATTWFGYLVQSVASINQIGIGIWGWIFSGAVIGYSRLFNFNPQSLTQKNPRKLPKTAVVLDPLEALTLYAGLALGLIVSLIPLRADAAFRAANDRRDAVKIKAATEMLGSTSFHSELFLDFTMRNNLVSEVKPTAIRITEKYPRDFFAWRVLSVASESTTQERNQALERAKALDPFNPQLKN